MLVSFLGIILFVYAVPASFLGFTKEYFIQTEGKTTDHNFSIKATIVLITAFGRVALILAGIILFLYGKYIQPTVQFAVILLILGILCESFLDVGRDYLKWRSRMNAKK